MTIFKTKPPPEPGDPQSAIRYVNPREILRVEIGSDLHALWVLDADGDRWVAIDWDGNITSGRTK